MNHWATPKPLPGRPGLEEPTEPRLGRIGTVS